VNPPPNYGKVKPDFGFTRGSPPSKLEDSFCMCALCAEEFIPYTYCYFVFMYRIWHPSLIPSFILSFIMHRCIDPRRQ
jgi:hypothetical protein